MRNQPHTVRHLAAGIAGLLATATLLLVAPAVASASTYTHTDPARDVRSGSIDGTSQSIGRREPRERSVDIRKVRVSHTADRVTVTIRTRAATPTRDFYIGISLRTPGGGTYEAGAYKMLGQRGSELTAGIDVVDCAGYRTTIDRAHRRTTVVVPTSCIGAPAWVRVGAGASRIHAKRLYADDGLRSGRIHGDMRYSPRIARG